MLSNNFNQNIVKLIDVYWFTWSHWGTKRSNYRGRSCLCWSHLLSHVFITKYEVHWVHCHLPLYDLCSPLNNYEVQRHKTTKRNAICTHQTLKCPKQIGRIYPELRITWSIFPLVRLAMMEVLAVTRRKALLALVVLFPDISFGLNPLPSRLRIVYKNTSP